MMEKSRYIKREYRENGRKRLEFEYSVSENRFRVRAIENDTQITFSLNIDEVASIKMFLERIYDKAFDNNYYDDNTEIKLIDHDLVEVDVEEDDRKISTFEVRPTLGTVDEIISDVADVLYGVCSSGDFGTIKIELSVKDGSLFVHYESVSRAVKPKNRRTFYIDCTKKKVIAYTRTKNRVFHNFRDILDLEDVLSKILSIRMDDDRVVSIEVSGGKRNV